MKLCIKRLEFIDNVIVLFHIPQYESDNYRYQTYHVITLLTLEAKLTSLSRATIHLSFKTHSEVNNPLYH